MTKQRLMDIANSTANELRKNAKSNNNRHYNIPDTYPGAPRAYKISAFHVASFLRGAEFAWNQMMEKKK